MAVFTLPPEMIGFYKKNIEFISEHAVDPDKRRYVDEEEAVRHYIDIDHYTANNKSPFEIVPQKWSDAVKKITEDTLQTYGILPWHIQTTLIRLTEAFKEKNKDKILRLSADIGHYIGDAHVPLHTTENYNGQMTDQKGIHGFWESRLPELKSEEYNFFVGKATYIKNSTYDVWEIIETSFAAKDSVLSLEKKISTQFSKDKKYAYEDRSGKLVKVYSEEYSTTYHKILNGMVERRMTQSIIKVGSYWYTAWVNAGQPKLDELISKELVNRKKQQNTLSNKEYNNKEIRGRRHDNLIE